MFTRAISESRRTVRASPPASTRAWARRVSRIGCFLGRWQLTEAEAPSAGLYQKVANWGPFVLTHGRLVAGQNPASLGEHMEIQNNRVTLDQHWAASASGDLEAEHQIYDDNVLCEYPQSGEKIRGRHNLQALRGHHPGKPSGFLIRRIVGINDLWVTEYVINYGTTVVQTVSIMEFQNGKVIHETQYFAEPFAAPAW